MSKFSKNAMSLCDSILRSGPAPWNFEGHCLELRQALDDMAAQGRYGDIRIVMNEFESMCEYSRLDAQSTTFLAALIPLSLDSAGYLLHKESEECASALVKNLIQHQTFKKEYEGELDLSKLMRLMFEEGFSCQALELLDAVRIEYHDDADALMAEVMKAADLALDDGYVEIIDWLKEHEPEITEAFRVARDQYGCVAIGLDLHDAGVELFGAAMMRQMFAPAGDDLIRVEEILGISPKPPVREEMGQEAIIQYMLHYEELPQEWETVPLKLSELIGEFRYSLDSALSSYNSDGRKATPKAINRVFAAMTRRARDYGELDAIVLQMNKVGCDLGSPLLISAINDIVPKIIESRPLHGRVPAILYLDKLMNGSGKVDLAPHAALITSKINEWIPNITLADLADYAKRIDTYPFDRKAMGLAIDEKWPGSTEIMKELLKDMVPKSIALHSRHLKVSILEDELGM